MIISFFGTVETGLFGLFLFLFSDVVNVVSDNALWVAILKQEFAKVIKGRFKQESGGANSVTAISKCTNKIYFVLAWSEGILFSIKASKRLFKRVVNAKR